MEAEVAICSEINTEHINTVWAEGKFLNVGVSRNQWAFKG
jgi:hypothetical protein